MKGCERCDAFLLLALQVLLNGTGYGYRHRLGDLLNNITCEGGADCVNSETQKK